MEVTDAYPYREVRHYVSTRREQADQVFATLAYFDGMQFAARAHAPAIFSVGLMDEITPPSTVFAAYNHYAGPHDIRVWPYNGHEAGELHQHAERIRFLEGLGIAPDDGAPAHRLVAGPVDIGGLWGHHGNSGEATGVPPRGLTPHRHSRRGETCPIRWSEV